MDINQIGLGPARWSEVASATNGTATATHAAVSHTDVRVPAVRHVITGFSFSASAAPAAAATLLVKNGTTTIFSYNIPTTFVGPFDVDLSSPYVCDQATACSIVASALGSGVIGTVVLRGMSVSD